MREQLARLRRDKAAASTRATALIGTVNNQDGTDEARADARTEFDKVMASIDGYNADISRIEAAIGAAASLEADLEIRAAGGGRSTEDQRNQEQRHSDAFRNYLVGGISGLNDDDREIIASMRANAPQNAQSTTAGEGGITIPTTTQAQIETAMLAFGGLRRSATVIRTNSGNPILMPTANDTPRVGSLLSEAATAPAGAGVPFGNMQLDAWNYTSGVEPISIQLIQDSQVNIEQYIGERLGERIGRAQAGHFISGTGAARPRGLMVAAPLGRTAAAASALAVVDLIELEHSVDPAYRSTGKYLLGDSALKTLRLLEDADGRPLWQAGLTDGAPDRINGKAFELDHEIADVTTGNSVAAFGQLSKYHIRDVIDIVMIVMREKYAESYQVGLVAFHRTDGDLLDAGTGAVKKLVMA